MSKRVMEHIEVTGVAKHYHMAHGGLNSILEVYGVEHIILGIRGGDVNKQLLQKEARWMFQLKTIYPDKWGVFSKKCTYLFCTFANL